MQEIHRLFALGYESITRKDYSAAIKFYDQILETSKKFPEVWKNKGFCHGSLGQLKEAEACYRQALTIKPNYHDCRFELGCVLLAKGQYKEGWKLFENRNVIDGKFSDRFVKNRLPLYSGQRLKGKTLYISKEQGFGDAIQFLRYVDGLKTLGVEKVTLLCEPQLMALFRNSIDSDFVTVVDNVDQIEPHDFWIYQMSLPMICEPSSKSQYLSPTRDAVEKWLGFLPKGKRIGISWRGNPNHANDQSRSMSTQALKQLLKPDLTYISLQKVGGEKIDSIIDMMEMSTDFNDTAGLIYHLDAVISVDTAVAHLTGALGKPGIVMLPMNRVDWRWGIPSSEPRCSHWYSSLTLIQQKKIDDWSQVIELTNQEIEKLL